MKQTKLMFFIDLIIVGISGMLHITSSLNIALKFVFQPNELGLILAVIFGFQIFIATFKFLRDAICPPVLKFYGRGWGLIFRELLLPTATVLVSIGWFFLAKLLV